jgi:hypothetical protein
MARIPLAPTGQVVARPGALVHVDSNQAIGQAVEQLGATAVNVADRVHQHQAQAEHEQEQIRKAAERAQAQATVGGMRDQLDDAHDALAQDVLNGVVPKEEAEKVWGDRSKEIVEADGGLSSIKDQTLRTIAQTDVDQRSARLGNRLRRAVELRGRQDVTVALDQTLEHYSRQYNGDPEKSTAMAMETVDQLAAFSDKPKAYWAAKKQAWKENTQYTAAFGVVNAAKSSPQLLDAAEKALDRPQFADLDPQRRAVLVNQIDGYRVHLAQKAEVAAARAERLAEHHMRTAKAEFDTALALADKGVFSPEYFERANAATAGTPYNAGLRGLLQQTREVGALATMPLTRQRAELDALNTQIAKNGISPELEKRRTQVENVVKQSEADYTADPMRAANERGVIQLKGLSLTNGIPGVVQQLGERVHQSAIVSQVTGKPVSPLTDQEAEFVKQNLETLPARERSQMVSMLAGAVGSQAAQGLATQIDKHDRGLALSFALAGAMTTNGRLASELVLKGQQAKKDGTSTKGDSAPEMLENRWKSFITTEVSDAFGNQKTSTDVRDAALLIAHGIAAEQGGRLTARDMERAVTLAVGGSVVEHNGRKLPLPAGVDEDALTTRLRSIKPDELQAPGGAVRAGGVAMPVADFLKVLPAQQLMPVRPGEYAVLVQGRPVLNAHGDPITIKVR